MSAGRFLRLGRIAAPFAVGTVLLALWEIVVRVNGIPPYILPGPLAVAASLWTDGPSLLGSLLVTLRVTLAALAAAAILGGAIALLFSLSRILELSLFPYAVILQVTPIVAIAPLIIIWVREPFLALLVCAWIVAFFPIVANTTVGLNSADRNLLALFRHKADNIGFEFEREADDFGHVSHLEVQSRGNSITQPPNIPILDMPPILS